MLAIYLSKANVQLHCWLKMTSWYQSWSELSSSPMPLSSSHHYGDFSIIVIGIIPCGSSFSLFMNILVHTHTPHTHTHTHTHTPPPCRQAIYREVITPVNDGNAELEPIKAADMTNSTPILHTHTHTHTHTQRDLSLYMWVVVGAYRGRGGVCMCVCFVCMLSWSISFGEVKSRFSQLPRVLLYGVLC